MELTTALSAQGVRFKDSQRYCRLQKRIRNYSTNEINRVLNRIMAIHNPAELVVEKLDFRFSGLSPRLNRILQRAGRAAAKLKLQMLQEDRGVLVTEVAAPYTSQGCVGCDYIDDRNRKNEKFRCRFCGRKGNANVEAARSIVSRRSWDMNHVWWGIPRLLGAIDQRFKTRWMIDPTALRTQDRRVRAREVPVQMQMRVAGSGVVFGSALKKPHDCAEVMDVFL